MLSFQIGHHVKSFVEATSLEETINLFQQHGLRHHFFHVFFLNDIHHGMCYPET
jgi:hypothetical protein